ncbi:unnamed protein product [Macrosiphum euphorbiae]|uniref:Uncharacterized protein n=1 Tax=Macrosiphum euphorbiae TaxID=13131 RepID=A0AAV0Y039_9HEMI|nr:unnamed protein product [Macrosiphum euphorbiae]CAI6373359.1 unnamed protein product [Macrosiphum euphorbiae]CAI6373360.1 unnamed protein product [Macrosiphum euphorbiae]
MYSIGVSRVKSEEKILLGVEASRRQFLDAIRASYEMIEIWLSHLMSDCNSLKIVFLVWAKIFIVRDHYVEVVREPNAEIQSNDLDLFIQDINFSDSESSSCESEISSAENEHTSDIYFDDGEFNEYSSINRYNMNDHITNKSHNQKIMRRQWLKRHEQWLKRRQQLRDRFKISRLESGSSAGPDDVCVSNRNQPSPRIDAITTMHWTMKNFVLMMSYPANAIVDG